MQIPKMNLEKLYVQSYDTPIHTTDDQCQLITSITLSILKTSYSKTVGYCIHPNKIYEKQKYNIFPSYTTIGKKLWSWLTWHFSSNNWKMYRAPKMYAYTISKYIKWNKLLNKECIYKKKIYRFILSRERFNE